MGMTRLYKYLDVTGGLAMLEHHNLQFTNASKFNDPFDCHPALFDYSHAPVNKNNWPPADFLSMKGENDMENLRNSTWMCCLSKVYDSLLMWAYYNNHKGICIGLNVEAVLESCQHGFFGLMYPSVEEVKYKDILQKPDYFKDHPSWIDLWTTKAKAWEHEQEVRLLLIDPIHGFVPMALPYKPKDKDELIDWKEVRTYPKIGGECFDSLYFGINIDKEEKEKIIKVAKERNPEIKIYQMTIDPEAFRLKGELI
jgi:hypothetical protein